MDYLLKKATGQLEVVSGAEPFVVEPAAGPGEYAIYRLDNGGTFTLADVTVLITANVAPLPQLMHKQQTVGEIDEVATLRQIANYNTNWGTITSVEILVNGSPADDAVVLGEGDAVMLQVSNSIGHMREWVLVAEVQYLARWSEEPNNTATLDFNDIVASDVKVPITLTSEPWATRGSFPVLISQDDLADSVQSVVTPYLGGSTALGDSPEFGRGFFFSLDSTAEARYTLTADDVALPGYDNVTWDTVTTYVHASPQAGTLLRLVEHYQGLTVHQSDGLAV